MNKQQTLQNIWAMTDKAMIDKMTKKTCNPPSTLSPNDSGDDNSDLESIDSRYGPFAAVPKEFRPCLTIRTKTESSTVSLNENKQAVSNQNPVSAYKPSAAKAVHKVSPNTKPPFFTNSKPSLPLNPKPPLLPNPKPFLLPNPPLCPNPKPPLLPNPTSIECKRISNRNETSVFNKDVNHLKHTQNAKNYRDENATTAHENTDVKNKTGINRKTTHQPPKKIADNLLQKRNEVLNMKGTKHEIGKKEIKYEYVGAQEHRTVRLNFEMPPLSNLQEQKKGKEEIIKKLNKNACEGKNKEFNKDPHPVLRRGNTVKWVSPFNSDAENTEDKIEYRVLYQENVVKWGSSFNLDNPTSDMKNKIEQDFGKGRHKVKWHNSLNLKDSSSDSEDEIKWTIIQKQKTIISAKHFEGKDHTQKQTNSKYLPSKPYIQKGSESNKHQHKRYFNQNMKQCKNYYRKNIPKPSRKVPENLVYNNDLQLNNNLQQNHNEIRRPNTQNECNLDDETFTQKSRVSDQNLDGSKVSPSLSNYKPEFMMYPNTRNTVGNWESESYSEKADNITLKHIEEQKDRMLNYGREISDLIIGSHTALSIFVSMFKEWKRSRLELISHFQYLLKNLNESSKKFTKYKDMLSIAKTGATIAAAVPLPHISVAARVISVLTGLFSAFLSSTKQKKAEVEDSNDMSIAATRDTNASTDVYMYGLLCGQNFEDTTKLIEEFHSNIANLEKEMFEKDSPEIGTFIRGVLEYKTRHRIFYKKLHKCFQELLQNCSSEFSKRFCEPFLLNSPGTVDVVEFLNWQFRHEDFNGESVRFELKQIDSLIQQNDTSIKELTIRIQTCVGILEDELKFLEGCVKDLNLFDKEEQF